MAVEQAPHATRPPFFEAAIAKSPQSNFHRHANVPRKDPPPTKESVLDEPRNPKRCVHSIAVTRGIRTSSFFWIQSLIRDDGQRSMLYDLGQVIASLAATHPDHPSVSGFLGHYHKLLQYWTEV
jgi:hypothetical protein